MDIYRGEIYWVEDRKDAAGSEMKKKRPAIVVSNNKGGNNGIATVVFLTTAPKKPLGVHHVIEKTSTGDCEGSTALCEQVTTVSTVRLSQYSGRVSDTDMETIDRCIMWALDLERYVGQSEPEVVYVKKEEGPEAPEIVEEPEIIENPAEDEEAMADAMAEIIKLQLEADFYKKQYEALLDRIMQKAKL